MNALRQFRRACAVAGLLLLAGAALAPHVARADAAAVAEPVRVVTDAAGARLQVGGRDFFIKGMNWDYIPIGTNYAFDLWSQPDDVIVAALEREMGLLHTAGVNAIRLYTGIPPKWVKYIHERWGIWVMLNHPCGRYGFTVDGVWHPSVDYSDPKMRAAIAKDVLASFAPYKDTPGILLWLLGNENNYGLSWSSFEIEALPKGERDAARATFMYSLLGEIITAQKAADPNHPVAIANGDVQYVDLIAQECKGLDVFGTNVYRGISVGDLFQVVKDKLGVPVMFTEFGCDAFNARTNREDQAMQARYLSGQWRELNAQSAGKGGVGNAIGGFVFQWSDGWWKYGQDSRLDVHDTHASWPDGGFTEDFVQGENNMNEEWWGVCAKGPADSRGLYELYPRAAFYVLRDAFRFDPYAAGVDKAAVDRHFATIDPVGAELQARGAKATGLAEAASRVRVSGLRLDFETVATGGERVTTPPASSPQTALPQYRGYDKMQTFYVDFEGRPTDNVTGTLSLNVLGHVPTNPINEIFYEKRGRVRTVTTTEGAYDLSPDRLKVYKGSISWDDRLFTLDGFFRTGHYHWGYEGDFFGLYREANYGTNTDVYDADAPVGFEAAGKRMFNGLKVAYGQELWWGANPAFLAKYRRAFGRVTATGLYQEDVSSQSNVSSSSAVPTPRTRKATLALEHARGPFTLTVGGIWSGSNKAGALFQLVEGDAASGYVVKEDEIFRSDALGAKAKLTYQKGRINWYAQAARMGLVADGGPTQSLTYTNWALRDVGTGNQTNFMTGVLVNQGVWQFGPNVLWQKPIIGPIPGDVQAPGRPRNVLEDPFAVRSNRETFGVEMMLGYDPTPGTWMWAWDNDVREDARFAASLDFVYRHLPTTQDVSIGVLSDGRTTFAFPSAPPKRDLWELRGRVVSRLGPDRRLVATGFVGDGEPNGDDDRVVHRSGLDARLAWSSMAFSGSAHFNDWGPYDYHRDFNLTFPMQLSADVSHTLGAPRWFANPQTAIGVRGIYRTLDEFSPRYAPDATGEKGNEWEFRSYLIFAL